MADVRKGRANVDIEQATHADLKKVRDELGLKKLGDVVRVLADNYFGRADAPESEGNEGEDDGEPVKRRKIDVREPLYSLDILAERPGMLEYYTGFDRAEVDLLIRRFSEVSLWLVFFPLLVFCEEASCGYGERVVFLAPTCRSSNPKLLIGGRATTAFESLSWRSESSCFSLV